MTIGHRAAMGFVAASIITIACSGSTPSTNDGGGDDSASQDGTQDGTQDGPVDGGGDAASDAGREGPVLTELWTNRTPAGAKAPDGWPTMSGDIHLAYDEKRELVVMFAGTGTSTGTWEWDNFAGTFQNRTPASRPATWPPRAHGTAMSWDPGRGRVLLYDGPVPKPRQWEWDGDAGDWAELTPAEWPASPGPREDAAIAADPDRKTVLLIGGWFTIGAGAARHLWEWDGAKTTWTDLTPPDLASVTWPGEFVGASMTYDASTKTMYLVGNGNDPYLWRWSTETKAWSGLDLPKERPAWWPESLGPALFQPGRKLTMVARAKTGDAPMPTLEFNTASMTWSDRTPAPPATGWPTVFPYRCCFAADPVRRTLLLIGRPSPETPGRIYPEVWEWDGAL